MAGAAGLEPVTSAVTGQRSKPVELRPRPKKQARTIGRRLRFASVLSCGPIQARRSAGGPPACGLSNHWKNRQRVLANDWNFSRPQFPIIGSFHRFPVASWGEKSREAVDRLALRPEFYCAILQPSVEFLQFSRHCITTYRKMHLRHLPLEDFARCRVVGPDLASVRRAVRSKCGSPRHGDRLTADEFFDPFAAAHKCRAFAADHDFGGARAAVVIR